MEEMTLTDNFELADEIRRLLVERHQTLSTAESCTSGRMAASLTQVSGASDYFQGGLVAYQDAIKVARLGVSQADIDKYDVVSEPVVRQMVKGACLYFNTNYALASTGYAGGGTDSIPSGTIWIAWGTPEDTHALCLTEDKGREWNTANATHEALQQFLQYLINQELASDRLCRFAARCRRTDKNIKKL